MKNNPQAKIEIPFIAVALILVVLTPIAMYFGIASVSASDPKAFPYGLGIAAALLSISGAALCSSGAGKVAVLTFALTVVAPFVLWLFTSSIGGQAPGPIGALLGGIGSCAGMLSVRIRTAAWIPLLLWLPVLALGSSNSYRHLSDMKAANMNAEIRSPAYVEANVIPELVIAPKRVSWAPAYFVDRSHSANTDPYERAGAYEASGDFTDHSGSVRISAHHDTANFTILLNITTPYKSADLKSEVAWLRSNGVRVDKLSKIEATSDGWNAIGPKDLKEITITHINDRIAIGGSVRIPPD